jgi:hypothetical protein
MQQQYEKGGLGRGSNHAQVLDEVQPPVCECLVKERVEGRPGHAVGAAAVVDCDKGGQVKISSI